MSTPAGVSAAVHLEIPGFAALSEQGHWDACAVVAEADALHVCGWNGVKLESNTIDAWRWQYVQQRNPIRWTQGAGTTLGNIMWHLAYMHADHIAGYIPYSGQPNMDQLHNFVKAQSLKQNPIIIEVSNAQALPHAEQGVHYHFVTLGGIDSTLGYLVANGDTLDALRGPAGAIVPTYWATWSTLALAGICGAIALDRGYAVPTPPPPPPPGDSSPDLHALAGDVLTALQKLTAALP